MRTKELKKELFSIIKILSPYYKEHIPKTVDDVLADLRVFVVDTKFNCEASNREIRQLRSALNDKN